MIKNYCSKKTKKENGLTKWRSHAPDGRFLSDFYIGGVCYIAAMREIKDANKKFPELLYEIFDSKK